MEVNDQPHAPTSSRPGKEPLVSIERNSGRASEGVWKFRRKIAFSLPGLELWALQPVAILTRLSRHHNWMAFNILFESQWKEALWV